MLLLLGRVAADRCRSSVGFSVVASPGSERESKLVQTEDRARLLPNTVLALGSSGLFKDKAPCGCASIRLGPGRNARRCTVTGDEVVLLKMFGWG